MADLRATRQEWDDLDGGDRRRIRGALARDFGGVCAYCQQSCNPPTGKESPDPNEETIEHFRPRDGFPDERFDWLNLLYACYRCNQYKGNKWPKHGDSDNQRLTRFARYTPVSEYVNPNEADGRKPAQEFFSFDFATGEMRPAEELEDNEWSMAFRTIMDIDLNDHASERADNDELHLMFQRRYQVSLLMEKFDPVDIDPWVQAARDAMLPDKPFSAYVSAYIGYLDSRLGPLFQGLDTRTSPP